MVAAQLTGPGRVSKSLIVSILPYHSIYPIIDSQAGSWEKPHSLISAGRGVRLLENVSYLQGWRGSSCRKETTGKETEKSVSLRLRSAVCKSHQ